MKSCRPYQKTMLCQSGGYDEVVSLGQWCATSLILRKLGLRSSSGPFDWLLGQKVYVKDYVGLMTTRFDGLFEKGSLVRVGEDAAERHVHYLDEQTGFVLRHDFTLEVPFDEEYPVVHQKYLHRAERLLSMLDKGCRLLFVHFRGEGHYIESEIVEALGDLRSAFPASRVDLLVVEVENGLTDPQWVQIDSGLVRVTGDFYDENRFDAVWGNEKLLSTVFGKIRARGRWRNLLRQRILSIRRRLFR